MRVWKPLLCLWMTLCAIRFFPSPISAAPNETASPRLSAESAILIEAESGAVICEKNADLPLPMASTTKIMTALTALSLCSPDTPLCVHPDAIGVEGSSVYLVANERLTLEELLYALLLESANDAALAIAIGISGSVEAFSEEMNRMADELGLKSTHFTNPHGLDDAEHYTTARELAIITQKALREPLFRTLVATKKTTISHPSEGSVRLLINHNKLLRLYEGCIGVKTGYTKRSGRCLVSAAERDGVTLIAVTLRAPDDWADHTALLDYGFSRYHSVLLCEKDAFLMPLPVMGGTEDYVMVTNTEALRVTLPKSCGRITHRVELPRFEYAPIDAESREGCVLFFCDTDGDGQAEIIGRVPLSSCYAIPKKIEKRSFLQWLISLFSFFH